MSIVSGQLSLSKFIVLRNNSAKISYSKIDECLKNHRAKAIKLNSTAIEEKAGWVCPNIFPEDQKKSAEAWDVADCKISGGVFLKVRQDKKRVSSSLLKTIYTDRCLQLERKREGGINREEKKALLDEIREQLLVQSLPTISYFEAYWSVNRDEVYVFSTAKSSLNVFSELFHKTFQKTFSIELFKPSIPITPEIMDLEKSKEGEDFSQRIREDFGRVLPTNI